MQTREHERASLDERPSTSDTSGSGSIEYPRKYRRRGPRLTIALMLLGVALALGAISLLIVVGVTLALVIGVVLVAGVVLLAATGVYFALTGFTVETRHFQVGDFPRVLIADDVGNIHVNRSEADSEVVIQVTKWNQHFWIRADRPIVCYEQDQTNNTITASLKRVILPGFFFPRRVDFDLTIPPHADVQLSATTGDIWVSDLHGQAMLQSETGSIHIRHSTLRNGSSAASRAGMISFQGDIEPEGTYTFASCTGSVHVVLEREVAYHVDASTNTGSITTTVPEVAVTRRGLMGEEARRDVGAAPAARLLLRTNTGSISLDGKASGHVQRWNEVYRVPA